MNHPPRPLCPPLPKPQTSHGKDKYGTPRADKECGPWLQSSQVTPNIPCTPSPNVVERPFTATSDYRRDLWTLFHSPTLPLPPYTPAILTRAMATNQPHPRMGVSHLHFPTCSPAHYCPPHLRPAPGHFPSNSEDSNTDALDPFAPERIIIIRDSLPSPREDDDPLNAEGPEYEWPALAPVNQEILRPESYKDVISKLTTLPEALMINFPWISTLPTREEICYPVPAGPLPLRQEYLPTEEDTYMALPLDLSYLGYDLRLPRSTAIYGSPYTPSPYRRVTNLTLMGETIFDHFTYDYETFGGMVDDVPYLQRAYRRVDSVPSPHPLPDSPQWLIRQHGQYHGPKTSNLFAGGDTPGGSQQPKQDNEECLWQAVTEAEEKQKEVDRLRQELEDAEKNHDDHVTFWRLPNKSKEPDRGQPADLPQPPNHYCMLWKQDDQYSVPCLPLNHGRPNPLPQPVGTADADTPFFSIKPIMMQIPKVFKGEHDDIECFFRDCMMYFEAFAQYFLLPSQTVPFAVSLFDRPAKDWWVHKRQEFWSTSIVDPALP
ncbi:uncharacterized protein ARMOST_04666 [Armillaria ostoyae]|uniref:Uncharacterized protein n=1 Tax=Armillaria ostoyae TaxID=47428 RepID=A0A284QXY6_ARMOS|nr:uncharacterized protein ARMOST_04666 [Armillaria ostoyae]